MIEGIKIYQNDYIKYFKDTFLYLKKLDMDLFQNCVVIVLESVQKIFWNKIKFQSLKQ